MNDDNIAFRLKVFIDSLGLTNSQFADTCGMPRPSLSQLLSGRNKKISDVIVGHIHRAFPQLSVLWLLFGEGEMLKTDYSNSVTNSNESGSAVHSTRTDDNRDSNIGQSDIFESNLFSQNEEYFNPRADVNKETNLTTLNSGKNASNALKNPCVESDLKAAELIRQIDKMRKNPRKVVQITVYYDDSTFETFVPNKI